MNIDDQLKDAARRTNSSLAGMPIPQIRQRTMSGWASAALAAGVMIVAIGTVAILGHGREGTPTTVPVGTVTTSTSLAAVSNEDRRANTINAIDSVLGVATVITQEDRTDLAWQRTVVETIGAKAVTVTTQLRGADDSAFDERASALGYRHETWDHQSQAWVHVVHASGADASDFVESVDVRVENSRYTAAIVLEYGAALRQDGPSTDPVSEADAVAIGRRINDALWSMGFGADQPETATTATASEPVELSYSDATWVSADSYEKLFTFPQPRDPETSEALLAVSVDGDFVGTRSTMPTTGGPEDLTLYPETPIVIDTSGDETAFAVPGSDIAYQAIAAAAANGAYAWRETSTTEVVAGDYRILVATAGESQARILADSGNLSSVPPQILASTETGIATDGANVYWAVPVAIGGSGGDVAGYTAGIVASPVDGSQEPRLLATGVVAPVVMGNKLLAVRYLESDPGVTEDVFEVVEVNTTDGDASSFMTYEIGSGSPVRDFCAGPTYVAFAHGNRIEIRYATDLSTSAVSVRAAGQGTDLACGDTFLAWGNGSGSEDGGEYLLDLTTDQIYELGTAGGHSTVMAAGDYLAWGVKDSGSNFFNQVAARWGETVATPTTTTTILPVQGALLPLSGWQDIGANRGVFGDATITGAVSLGDTIVATGCATNDGGAGGFPVWTSTDGATWEQASGPSSAGYFELDCADNLTATPFGLYATAGALLHSEDGRTWEAISLPTHEPDGVTGSIFVADAVFPTDNRVTLLLSTAGESESRWDVIYTTTDGYTWTEGPAESARLFDSSDVSDVLVTSGGLIAVGASPGGEFVPTAAVWTSADGLNWQKVTDGGAEFAEASMNAVIESEGGYVAVGTSTATGQMASWTSANGVMWSRQAGSTEHVDADVAYMTATSITEVGGALYAAGEDFDARRPDASQAAVALWMSGDGATWERLLDRSTAIPFNIVSYGSDSIGFWPPPRWGAIAPVQVLSQD